MCHLCYIHWLVRPNISLCVLNFTLEHTNGRSVCFYSNRISGDAFDQMIMTSFTVMLKIIIIKHERERERRKKILIESRGEF